MYCWLQPTHHFLDRSLELVKFGWWSAFWVGNDDRLLFRGPSSHGQRHHDSDQEGGKKELHIVVVVPTSMLVRIRQAGVIASRVIGDLLKCR